MATTSSLQAKPSNKTLSTGTLSLRFMQNAHRAKHLAQVEAEQAQVKDEAEWEVAKEVREAWGLDGESGSGQAAQSVSYETSYIPFLFDRDTDDDVVKPKGRRIFNKHGKEVEEVAAPILESPQTQLTTDDDDYQRPMSISGTGSSSAQTKPRDFRKPLLLNKDPAKSARQIIRDSSGVGTDIRARAAPAPPMPAPVRPVTLGNAFIKPSGVDAPKVPSGNNTVIQGARTKSQKSAKREREGDNEISAVPTPGDGDKVQDGKKKKKKVAE